MTTFNDLPLELLSDIVQNVVKPENLTSFCLVSKAFCEFTRPFLYHTVAVFPWHHKKKIIKLFRTLSSSPELARHVRKLEIRDFPKGLDDDKLDSLVDSCLRGIANTINLRSCTWTRDGTLCSSVLLAILKHRPLQELEINGHHYGNYDHTILPRFTSVRRITLIMPSPPVLEVLPAWLKSLENPLQSLSIVCKSYTVVTDALLEQISEDLFGLDELHLASCQRVTHEGLVNALRCNKNGIKRLSIEHISRLLDLPEFDRQCRKAQLLNRLTSLTITVNVPLWNSGWAKDILSLVSSSPLEYFQLYGTTTIEDKEAQLDDLVTTLISVHGSRLKRLSLHRLPISLKVLDDVCTSFTNLEQLFVVVEQEALELIGNSLLKATRLQAVHIDWAAPRVKGTDFSYVSTRDVLQVANQCSPTLTQIGCSSRVWQVVRGVTQAGEDQATTTELAPCEWPEVPDQFRVVQR